MKANHLRSIAVLTVLAAAFLWFVLSYGQVSAYEDPVVCWDGSHKYLNRGPNTQGGDISGCHQVMKFCKCASQTHEYGYWNGSYYEHANSEGEAFCIWTRIITPTGCPSRMIHCPRTLDLHVLDALTASGMTSIRRIIPGSMIRL